MFMNSPQTRRYATSFAQRLGDGDLRTKIESGYLAAFARRPSPAETSVLEEFINHQKGIYKKSGQSNSESLALTDFCQTLFSLNEFVFID